jgi:phosphoribosylformimino-5-aminoimidazole carboxamide ribotide isomerase
MMDIIPAIDLIDGACVRLTKGDYNTKLIYEKDPLTMAKKFEDAGIRRLHLVDLDGAKAGKVINLRVLEKLTTHTSLEIDFGGGIKTENDLKNVIDAGAKWITIGSLAVKEVETMKDWIVRYSSKTFILGADLRDGYLSINGWLENSNLHWKTFMKDYISCGVNQFLCTDIAKDGMLSGPSTDLYCEIMDTFPGIYLIASGGVSGKQDLIDLEKAKIPAVVLGKAIYENKITLKEITELSC